MGRYIRGDAGFQYKYIYAEQPANLTYLAEASGVGRSGLLPVLTASYAFEMNPSIREGDALSVPCISLLREIIADGVAQEGETDSFYLPPSGDTMKQSTTESLQYVLAENIGEVLWRLDSRWLVPPVGVFLEAYGGYSIGEGEYPKLMQWVNRFLPAERALDEEKLAALGDKQIEEYFGLLGGAEEFMPFMALRMLAHVAQKKLASFSAQEISPEISADNFWSLVQDWQFHTGLFDDREKGPRERFLRGLIYFFDQRKADAIKELRAAEDGGEARATRYLDFLLARKETIEAVPPPAEPLGLTKPSAKKAAAKPKAAGKSAKKKVSAKKKAASKLKAAGKSAKKKKPAGAKKGSAKRSKASASGAKSAKKTKTTGKKKAPARKSPKPKAAVKSAKKPSAPKKRASKRSAKG